MFLKFNKIIEGSDLRQLAGMDQAHKDIADASTTKGLVEEGVTACRIALFNACSQRECRLPDYAALSPTLRRISYSHWMIVRHNQRLSRRVSRGSRGR